MAAIVKIVLNAGLGVLATIVAMFWQQENLEDEDRDNEALQNKHEDHQGKRKSKKINWIFLWDKFPKFILGYIICSCILSLIYPHIKGMPEADALQRAVVSMNQWWFSIAFVGIGMSTNVPELWKRATKSGIIKLYLVSNLLDIFISLGLAYLSFGKKNISKIS